MLHFIDVTEQKNLEVQFAQSQKMQAVGQLAGGVAHDFNNLLTAMIGFCDLLLMRFRPGDPSFADIMQIKQNANRAANLVRQLLAFSRQQTLQPRVLDITDVLRRAVAPAAPADRREHRAEGRPRPRSRPRQGRSGAARTGDHQPGGQRARRDGGRRHADDPHRQRRRRPAPIRRGARDHAGRQLRADRGRRYRRRHPEGKPGAHLRAVLLDQGGRLRAPGSACRPCTASSSRPAASSSSTARRARAPFSGSTCRATRRPRASRGARGEPPRRRRRRDLTGIGTVMLVEDEDPVRIFGARALRNKGYKVLEAKSGEAALDLIRGTDEKIDLLITDVVMPRMDGPTLVRRGARDPSRNEGDLHLGLHRGRLPQAARQRQPKSISCRSRSA